LPLNEEALVRGEELVHERTEGVMMVC